MKTVLGSPRCVVNKAIHFRILRLVSIISSPDFFALNFLLPQDFLTDDLWVAESEAIMFMRTHLTGFNVNK